MIGKGDFEEMRRWNDQEDIWSWLRKDFGNIYFFVWKFLGDDEREAMLLSFWGGLKVGFWFWFWVVANKRSYGSEVCRSMFWGKVQKQSAAQCTQRGRVDILERGMMVEQGEWWEVLKVSRTANNSSQEFLFVFCLYLGLFVLLFKSKYLDFGNSKGL